MSEIETKSDDQARGKILRLPFDARMEFNRMVRDGFKGPFLIDWLAAHGVPDVNAQNLTDYRRSRHYQDWLAEEAEIERDRANIENAMRLAESMGGSASEQLTRVLAGKLFSFSRELGDPSELKALVGAFSAITDAERLQLQRRQTDQKEEQLDLARKKFQRDTCELIIKYVAEKKVVDIAADATIGNDAKIEMLGQMLFQENW
jgi:hypothetical protein